MSDERMQIVLNFDTTGSMYPCLTQVRRDVEKVLSDLFKEIPNLEIGLGANGDYGDLRNFGYTTNQIDLTTNLYELAQFVRNVPPTGGGGNGGEAYELVLNEAQSKFSWRTNAKKVFVLIGDEPPHTTDYWENKNRFDWRIEGQKLANLGVQIYTVQCLSRRESTFFYEGLAKIGNGLHLELDQFTDIVNLVRGIVYRQISKERFEQFEDNAYKTSTVNRTLGGSFDTLAGRPRDAKGRFTKVNPDLAPVPAGRFQMMDVPADIDIKGFVLANGLAFQKGKGFYQFTKTEDIQDYKEIVLRDKKTGDMFSGPLARAMIGLPTVGTGHVRPVGLAYDVFVQSTSVNRKLKAKSMFLYEVDMAA